MGRRREEVKIFVGRSTDWTRVMLDLRGKGFTIGRISRHLDVEYRVAKNWTRGCEPKHRVGEALLDLHSEYCCSSAIFTAQVT